MNHRSPKELLMPIGPKTYEPPKITPLEGSREHYRKWYRLALWRGRNGLREQQLRKQPLCEDCLAENRTQPATDVDHQIPHRGNWDLFIDQNNHRSRCHSHHSQKTGRGL